MPGEQSAVRDVEIESLVRRFRAEQKRSRRRNVHAWLLQSVAGVPTLIAVATLLLALVLPVAEPGRGIRWDHPWIPVLTAVSSISWAFACLWYVLSSVRTVLTAGESRDEPWVFFGIASVFGAILILAFTALYMLVGVRDSADACSRAWVWAGVCHSPATALFFSVITATTLGYGDVQAYGIGRFIAPVQAISGVLFMGVFTAGLVYLLGRRDELDLPLRRYHVRPNGVSRARNQRVWNIMDAGSTSPAEPFGTVWRSSLTYSEAARHARILNLAAEAGDEHDDT